MEIMPNEYQHLELSKSEKMFIRYAGYNDKFGFLFLNTNPALVENDLQHVIINDHGVLIVKFFDEITDANIISSFINIYKESVYSSIYKVTKNKLMTNRALIDNNNRLKISFNVVCVFPNIERESVNGELIEDQDFYIKKCIFKDDFIEFKRDFDTTVNHYLQYDNRVSSDDKLVIDEKSISSIVQRIVPEYTIIRASIVEDTVSQRGVDEELLVVDENDIAVKAFMLDSEQINIVNKMNKGEQLILACAGSGKSVLLIAKCFKMARMNPSKRFLITCYSRQLQSLYSWYIDRAGLKERNVECITFHKLCKKIAGDNGFILGDNIENWPMIISKRMNIQKIKNHYYGIFIDEVQLFEREWYKICYNLLDNKNSNDHIFVICGDKTQEIKKRQKRGEAPWSLGEGYPSYRGGNKSIRIEKNYRNCIQINNYINDYVIYAKKILASLPGEKSIDPDMFLRGKSIREGIGIVINELNRKKSSEEAEYVVDAIMEAHDYYKIPYDEIAVVMYNRSYAGYMKGWGEKKYSLERQLLIKLIDEDIPRSILYSDNNQSVKYGNSEGVALISFDSVLGLDFRAVIVCGIMPLGEYDKTKHLTLSEIEELDEDDPKVDSIKNNINHLYVACTRARDLLYIIQPEEKGKSLYVDLLIDAAE